MIKIQGLHKYFNKGRQNEIHVINDVNLDLPDRGMVAIFGRSGCGKTTLLNVIGGLDKFGSGSLTVEGQDIRQNTDVLRNQYVGYIFQNYNLNKGESCFDNVADALRLCGMTDPAEIEKRVMAALTNVGMEKYSKRPPDTLSGGQQQRIAIARAIVKNPRIILADEPTGNLDEANTVMVMDLLKAISKDHLVLLVTHEANLVDYYCDTVIELSDGKVVNIRNNASATGYLARDKNDIYLGELERTSLQNDKAEIEYYGDTCGTPIRLKIINNGGKLYVQINTPKVQVIDEFSEVRLREGVYEQKTSQDAMYKSIDMSALPPVKGTRFGRLFSMKSSIKSGYVANFKNNKKGKRILRGCMCLFAAVIVFMSAVFGTSIDTLADVQSAYNHNVFYVYTPNGEISQKLNHAVGADDSGIDYVRMMYDYPRGDDAAIFRMGDFETFSVYYYAENFRTNAVYMDLSLADDLPLVVGKKDDLTDYELLITTKVADALIEKSSLGHISEYKHLIGLLSNMFPIDGRNARIAGIVESDEPAIYLTELAMAKNVNRGTMSFVYLADQFGMEVAPGEAILTVKNLPSEDVKLPAIGDTVKLYGKDIKVVKVLKHYYTYEEWLEGNGVQIVTDETQYFKELIGKEQPDLATDSDTFLQAVENALNERHFEYLEYYYDKMEDFLRDYSVMEPYNLDIWMAVEKDVEPAKYLFVSEEFYKAVQYKNLNGRYPSLQELKNSYSQLPDLKEELEHYYAVYENEFYNINYNSFSDFTGYLVSESDYITFSKQIGETDPTALPMDYFYYEKAADTEIQHISGSDMCYTLIHSDNPKLTAEWLEREFPNYDTGSYLPAIVTPDDVFDSLVEDSLETIIASITAMIVILIIMSICMYFIMRSSLMNRIKEVGIYRAIGVSKKNLVYKFIVEAIVLTTLTVFIGYLLTSAFLYVCLELSPLVKSVFYYPIWMAGGILVILYGLCLFCGTLPITMLLRKTPSEILAKYDI